MVNKKMKKRTKKKKTNKFSLWTKRCEKKLIKRISKFGTN